MSQRTPIATPPRRQNARSSAATPGSAKSTMTPSTSTPGMDRAALQDRLDTIEIQVRDLKRDIAAERQRRLSSSQRRRDKERATFAASHTATHGESFSPLSLLDMNGHTAPQIKEMLVERLRAMDDDALTALLTASTTGLAALIAGQTQSQAASTTYFSIDAGLIPSKSVGIEGVGSGSDVDRRLLLASDTDTKSKKQRTMGSEDIAGSLRRARHARSVNEWLQDRQKRSTALIEGLMQFTHLDIESIKQSEAQSSTRSGSSALGTDSRRNIQIKGIIARLFSIDIRFDVIESSQASSSGSATVFSSPEIQNLKVSIPQWLESTLDEHHNHFSKLVRRNDLPAVLLTLRTLIPLISLRRSLFTSLMVRYTDLVREHIRTWEAANKVQFQPWQPSPTRKRAGSSLDKPTNETLAKSLIVPQHAQTLTLENKKGAKLDVQFKIRWNRYGHASPDITVVPYVPSHFANGTAKAFLATFNDSFQHLMSASISQTAEVSLPDMDEEEDFDPSIGRFGVLPAVHATIQAFFGLRPSKPRAPNIDDGDDNEGDELEDDDEEDDDA